MKFSKILEATSNSSIRVIPEIKSRVIQVEVFDGSYSNVMNDVNVWLKEKNVKVIDKHVGFYQVSDASYMTVMIWY